MGVLSKSVILWSGGLRTNFTYRILADAGDASLTELKKCT